MFAQAGPLQIDNSVVPGAGIVTPAASYITLFWAPLAGVMTLHCKESDGTVHNVITTTGVSIICGEVAP